MTDRRTGDTLPALEDVTPWDLNVAGSATLIHVQRPDGTLISRAPTVATGTTGAWSLPWLATELDTAGAYGYEAETTDAAGKVRTHRYGGFRVRSQLDGGNPFYAAPISIVDNGDGTTTVTWS